MEPELAAQKQPRPRRRSRRASGLSAEGAAGPSADTPGPGYSLRRGSSFTFLTPGPHWDFTLKRKRREKDDDVVSLSSLDLKVSPAVLLKKSTLKSADSILCLCYKRNECRGFGGRDFFYSGPLSFTTIPSHCRRHSDKLNEDIAIYEMSRGEQDLIEDLKLARKAYHDPMLKLSIMSEEELTHIFGDLDSYIPLHEDLLARIGEATKPDGTVEQIGHILVDWLPGLNAYRGYCSNQLAAKALLDQKKQDPRVQDFLQRCLESPFSRKLDLWSFLDIPRSRLVKYPLLLKEILRHTPKDHPDVQLLEDAVLIIQGVLSDINLKKGESECQYYIDKLEYLDEKQKDPRIEASKVLLCHGELKNKNGHVRASDVHGGGCHSPFPPCLVFYDFIFPIFIFPAKNIFRVRFQDPSPGQSHTLQANDVFHKQQWFNCIRAAIAPFQPAASPPELQGLPELHEECEENSPSAGNLRAQRRVSTVSSVTQVEGDENAAECGSGVQTAEHARSVKARQTQPSFQRARDKAQSSGKRKETLV
uniref:Neuroepithelial cell transforming 1 n=1 Tax=Propithecus coquereli TaxID=379532 RepID=A0A2K6EUH5_PROCO